MKERRKIIPYNPQLKLRARELRNNSTKAEIILWLKLKGKQICGYDFHRQKPIDNYILDFFCNELMLGIEVDGYSHQSEKIQKKDAIKEKRMNTLGINVLRFTDGLYSGIQKNLSEHEVKQTLNPSQEEHTPNPSQEGN